MDLLSECYLFDGLSASQLQNLTAITLETQIEEGQWLLQEGHEAKELYVLKEGAVELITKVDDTFELPIAMLRDPGSCFGTSALVSPHTYSLSARCVEAGTIFAIRQGDMQELIREDRDLGCTLLTNWAAHLLNRLKENRQQLKIHFKTLIRSLHS
jgi:CRP/FNR family transcriptional regulator